MKNITCSLQFLGGFFVNFLFLASLSQAQITIDKTSATLVSSSDNLNFFVLGGSQAGRNLFHSFHDFSVPQGGSVFFDNTSNIQNIISRVTGGSVSNIEGLIKANFSANLFLINPSGIVFGPKSRLDIGGSFLASTANQINFADGKTFQADSSQSEPLLTASMPIGLQFREKAGVIRNQSQIATISPELGIELLGLSVKPGKTLALIGSGVFIDGGGLSALEGRVEIGSISGSSLVNFKPIDEGWSFSYENVQNFEDIKFSREARIVTSGEGSGAVSLRGRRIIFRDSSSVQAINFGEIPGQAIFLNASDLVEVSQRSSLSSITFADGKAGNITIDAKRLIVDDAGTIEAASEGIGSGGDIAVNATELIDIRGGSFLSRLTTYTNGDGNAGNLKITTNKLILRDGGQISTSTFNVGKAGQLTIDSSKLVEISGQSEDGSFSGLFSQSRGSRGKGDAGRLVVNARQLVVRGGGRISVGSVRGSKGQGGELIINASEVEVTGKSKDINGDLISSTLLAESDGVGNAGYLRINANTLLVRDGAEVKVSASGSGSAGTLKINVKDLLLDNQGSLKAETKNLEGNIFITASNSVRLRNNSTISTNAEENANGGNITIDTPILLALSPTGSEGSDIKAKAKTGAGGNITINAQGIFGIEVREALKGNQTNDIDASSQFGRSGQVDINPATNPNNGLTELPETVVDPDTQVAQSPCNRGWGNELTVSGRGGLPPSPRQDLSSEATQVKLVEPVQASNGPQNNPVPQEKTSSINSDPGAIAPAQGWIYNDKGQVLLVAYNPTVTGPQRLKSNPPGCPVP